MADSDSVENGKPLNVPDSQNSPRSRGDSVVGDSAGTSRRPTSSGYQLAARSSLSSSLSIHESATVEAAVQGSSETFFFSASDVQPKFEVGWRRAASGYFDENLLEQKMWIQCTLKGAKQRGEDWIDSKFIDDKHANSGCTACLPDIVVVNDPAIKESSDAFKSRISAPWQRVWTRDEADAQTKRTYKTPPPVANSMLSRFSPEYPDTYLYDQKRSCSWFQRCCASVYTSRIFEFVFRGGKSINQKFPKVEPAKNFRCGIKGLQERAVIYALYMIVFFTLAAFALSISLRVFYDLHYTKVDYDLIDSFTLTCAGCKIQITNDMAWAGLFSPSNFIMYLPLSGLVSPRTPFQSGRHSGLPNFCSASTRSCDLVVGNTESALLPGTSQRWFTEDQVDQYIYAWPTIDIIVPSSWKGTLIINNNNISSPNNPQKTIIVPFNGYTQCTSFLYATLCPGISLPSLSINAQSSSYPIFFNGFRGGQFRNVNMNSVSGTFVARGATFTQGSSVNVNIPMGDIIISANQQIKTTSDSLYAATPPVLSASTPPTVGISSSSSMTLAITLTGVNFRNAVSGDFQLIVPNGTCATPPLPGLGVPSKPIPFLCDFSGGITRTGSVSGLMFLSYFGGNMLSTKYILSFSVVSSSPGAASVYTIQSPSVAPSINQRTSSGEGCGLSSTAPGNVCAVAASAGSAQVSNYQQNQQVTMSPANSNPSSGSFSFSSTAARSLTLGSYQFSIGSPLSNYATSQQNPESPYSTLVSSIAGCPIVYDPKNPVTAGQIASRNPNYNIPYQEQLHLLDAVNQLYQGNVSFAIIKVNGAGANLPGYFTMSLVPIYNVIDPAIIKTLTFGLLDIPFAAVNVSISPGLCPDLSNGIDPSVGISSGSPITKSFVWPRISQFYQILSDFLAPEINRPSSPILLFFQFQTPVNIWKTAFSPVSTGSGNQNGFTLSQRGTLGLDANASALLFLSMLFPVIAAIGIVVAVSFLLVDKITDYRKEIFLSTVEGERLSRLEIFSDLAQVPFALKTHVSELFEAAPAEAHLQSKFKADLLKIMSLFEIQDRKSMPEHSRWAAKVRKTPFTFKKNLKIAFKQFFALSSTTSEFARVSTHDDDDEPDALEYAAGVESYKTYLFRSLDTKFVRKVSFTSTSLEHGLQYSKMQSKSLDDFKFNKFIEFGFKKENRPLNEHSSQYQADEQLRLDAHIVFDSELNEFVLTALDNPESLKIFDFTVVRSKDQPFDSRLAYCIRHVKPYTKDSGSKLFQANANYKTFQVFSLNSFAPLKFDREQTVSLNLEDPYVIDDEFIEYAFSENAFDYQKLLMAFALIYNQRSTPVQNPSHTASVLKWCLTCFKKSSSEQNQRLTAPSPSPKNESIKVEMNDTDSAHDCVFGAPVFQSSEIVNWNPFRDRIILTVAAILFDSIESYRAITSSTGVESFFDLLIVNGSKNLKKWKLLGSIDDIMDAFYRQKTTTASADHESVSRIPAVFEPAESAASGCKWRVRCNSGDVAKLLKKSALTASAEFSLHGPAFSSKDAIRLTGSNDGFAHGVIVADSFTSSWSRKDTFREKLEYQPFQPGCIFRMSWPATAAHVSILHHDDENEKNSIQNVSFTVASDTRVVPDIHVEFGNEKVDEPNCHLHAQCFQALQQRVTQISATDDENSGPVGADMAPMTLYAHQLLEAYKPKGRNALFSPFLHAFITIAAVLPTLAFFGYWGFNQYIYYSMNLYWSLAVYFVILIMVYIVISIFYFVVVYLDFPYLFYGTSLVSYKINHFFFSPLTGAWFPNTRRLFYVVFGALVLVDVSAVLLFFIWLSLGVVVKPALAIPFFTGVAVFIGNIISLKTSIQQWQETIVKKVLEQLEPLLDRFKPSLLKALDTIIDSAQAIDKTSVSAVDALSAVSTQVKDSPLASLAGPALSSIVEKMVKLRDSIDTNDLGAFSSSLVDMKNETSRAVAAVRQPRQSSSTGAITFRKLTETEMAVLLKSLWTTIREELGLSVRNIFLILLSSSTLLGLFLLFIFIGIGIFSDGTNPFNAVVNAGLTVAAGAGVNQRSQTENAQEGNSAFDAIVTKFLTILEARLKKAKAIVIQILVVMMSTEAESVILIAKLQEMKFALDDACRTLKDKAELAEDAERNGK